MEYWDKEAKTTLALKSDVMTTTAGEGNCLSISGSVSQNWFFRTQSACGSWSIEGAYAEIMCVGRSWVRNVSAAILPERGKKSETSGRVCGRT